MTRDVAPPPPRTTSAPDCPVCGKAGRVELRGVDRMHGVPGVWEYRRCHGCSTVWQDPRVIDEDVDRLYPQDYYTHAQGTPTLPGTCGAPVAADGAPAAPGAPGAPGRDAADRGLRGRLRAEIVARVRGEEGAGPHSNAHRTLLGTVAMTSRWMRERAFGDHVMDEMLPRRCTTGRALDVGCGSGRLLVQLRAAGWTPEGLEPDPRAADAARARGVGPVRVGTVPEDLPDGPFDLVTLVHVFEHLADPVGALRRIADALSPTGRIVLVWPNPQSLLARRWGQDWYGWEIPRHLSLLTVRALGQAAPRAGLRVRGCRTTGRWATGLGAQSRALREGVRALRDGLPDLAPTAADRILARAERAMVRIGLPVGEEIVATLVPDRPGLRGVA